MEILLDTIRKGQSTEKGRLLMNSSISHEIDFNHDPCIFIEYFDKLVPYVLIPWILEETTRDVLTACDLFKIFPASQELATLFYTQFIKLVESRIGDENIRDVYQGICRIDINSFKPLLFRSGEFKSEMSRVVDFYIAFRNRDGMFLKTFENLRCEILYELGIKTDACVILAQKIRGVSSTREIIEYGIAVLCVYSVNLELQGLVTLLVGDVHQEKLRIDLLQQVDRVRGLFEASLV